METGLTVGQHIKIIHSMCITLPSVQFYLTYGDDGILNLQSQKFENKGDILECYQQTDNFYRWVYVERINDPDWNLEELMPMKINIIPRLLGLD